MKLVPEDQIETIVGVPRDEYQHYARAVSAEQTVYILHSKLCKENIYPNCAFQQALERGLDMNEWYYFQDQPVLVHVHDGYLHPVRL